MPKKKPLPALRAGRWCREDGKGTVLYIVQVSHLNVNMSYGPNQPIAVQASHSDFERYFTLIREPVSQPKLMPRSREERREVAGDPYTDYGLHVIGCERCKRAARRAELCTMGKKLVATVFGPPAEPVVWPTIRERTGSVYTVYRAHVLGCSPCSRATDRVSLCQTGQRLVAPAFREPPPALHTIGGNELGDDDGGQSAAFFAAHANDPPPGAPDYRTRLARLQAELATLGAEAFYAGRARERREHSAAGRFVFEGTVKFRGLLDVCSSAGIAPVGNDTGTGLCVLLQSHDRRKEHTEARSIDGKRIRVTVEIL